MAATEISFSDLNTWLQSQPNNTIDTPYELNITELTPDNLTPKSVMIGSTWLLISDLAYALYSNQNKYVDLRSTILPSGITTLTDSFSDANTMVYAPTIPSSVINTRQTFSRCSSLKEPPIIESVDNIVDCYAMFDRCSSLQRAPIISKNVTNIGVMFNLCTSLTEAPEIPNGVTNVYATFSECSSLIELPNLPDSITEMGNVFGNCTSATTWKQKNMNFDVPIGNIYMFYGCTRLVNFLSDTPYKLKNWLIALRNITTNNFPNNPNNCNYYLYSSPESASEISFNDLNNDLSVLKANTTSTPFNINVTDLTDASVKESTTSGTLGYVLSSNSTKYVDLHETRLPLSSDNKYISTFYNCTTLIKAPQIAVGTEVLGATFSGCTNLVQAPSIPPGMQKLLSTFSKCASLTTSPSLPNSIEDMETAFYKSGLTTAPVLPNSLINMRGTFAETQITTPPVIPSNVTKMNLTFQKCASLTEAPNIPSSVTNIQSCFEDCTSLTTVFALPANITDLSNTFKGCTSLITIPGIAAEDITSMGAAFKGCTSLTTIKWKKMNSVASYGDAFNGCTSLLNFYTDTPHELKTWLSDIRTESTSNFPNDVNNCNFNLYSAPDVVEFDVDVLENELSALSANTVSTPFNIKVTGLQTGANENCYDIRTALLANTTKYVDLHETVMPDALTTTYDPFGPYGLFEGCTTLVKGVSFSANSQMQNMTGTYKGCSNLKTLPMIPANTSVMNNTFRDCTSLELSATDKIVLNDSQQTIQLTSVFNGCTAIITCAEDLIPENADSISFFFKGCTSLETAPDIPDGVTDIHNMFEGCTLLTAAPEIPDSVTNMDSVFEGCTALETVPNVPDSVTNLTESFKGCSSLEEIELFEVPMSVLKTNAQDCFSGCTSLTSIKVPGTSSIEEADDWHFLRINISDSGGSSYVSGKVYDRNKQTVTIPQTAISKGTLTLPIKTDELWFPPSGMSDAEIDELIEEVIDNKYTYWNKEVIPPNKESFVLYAKDPNQVVTNLPMSGSGIKVYDTEDEIIEDLPNLSVGSIVASRTAKDPAVGVPLGTWASFANDSAPNNEWLRAGTTFNENTFPALAMMLGSNVVPEMFDHNRPGDWEDVASTNTFTPNYDGFMAVSYYNSGVIIKVNGVQIDIDNSPSNANGNMTLPFKKGDVITFFNVYDGSARAIAFKVYYYKHPLFIKATPTSSDSDYEGTLNGIRGHISNTVSYSTEEKWTGGYWIDGKKIYKKCTQYYKDGQLYGGCSITNNQLSGVLPSDYDTIIDYEMLNLGIDSSTVKFWDKIVGSRQYNRRINIYETNNVKATTVYVDTGYYTYNGWFTILYTKTTED